MINPVDELRDFLTAALIRPVPRDHSEPPDRLVHRRWVSAVALAVGSFLMAWTIRIPPGDPMIFASTLALTTTWVVGAFLGGKVYLGAGNTRRGTADSRAIIQAFAIGLGLVALYLAGAVVLGGIPVVHASLVAMFDRLSPEMLPLLGVLLILSAIAEELFFRGGLFAAIGDQQPVPISAFVYALSTVPTGNPMLVFGSAVLGLVLGLQRRVTGGVLGPVITHVTWTLGMMFLLPEVVQLWG